MPWRTVFTLSIILLISRSFVGTRKIYSGLGSGKYSSNEGFSHIDEIVIEFIKDYFVVSNNRNIVGERLICFRLYTVIYNFLMIDQVFFMLSLLISSSFL